MSEEVKPKPDFEKELVGKTVVLSKGQTIFVEDAGQYVLNAFFDDEKLGKEFKSDRVKIEKDWSLKATLRNIKAGVLRVLDENEKDVSGDFGGTKVFHDYRKTPIVTDAIPRLDLNDHRDLKLKKILDDVDEKNILNQVTAQKFPFELVQRLLDLELAGENPAFRSRAKVVDGLKTILKNTVLPPGQLVAARMDDDEVAEVVKAVKL